jgi:hypothetical protein
MSIEYIEILDITRTPIGVIDTAKSIIWNAIYYGVGKFEIYAQATPRHLLLLTEGNYVSRNDTDDVGVIESVNITFDLKNGYMIVASGRFAKSILDRRLIYRLSGHTNKTTIISGKVEVAARKLVQANAINCSFDSRRNIPNFVLGQLKGFTQIIVDENGDAGEKQVSYQNLLKYTDELLQEYGLAAKVTINDSNKNLLYHVYSGADRSTDNTDNNDPIVFSVEYDNLNSSNYLYDITPLKNSVLIGGEGEGLDRFYALYTENKSGMQLREIFVDASSMSKTYTDDEDVEHTYTDAQYTKILKQQGRQTVTQQIATETFNGDINVSFGMYQLNRDYSLGDIVTVQDNFLGVYSNQRITETTEVQDENGYTVAVVFGE